MQGNSMIKDNNMKILLSDKTEVTLREPLVKDLRTVSNITNLEEKEIALIALLTGLNDTVIDEWPLIDYQKVSKALASFLS